MWNGIFRRSNHCFMSSASRYQRIQIRLHQTLLSVNTCTLPLSDCIQPDEWWQCLAVGIWSQIAQFACCRDCLLRGNLMKNCLPSMHCCVEQPVNCPISSHYPSERTLQPVLFNPYPLTVLPFNMHPVTCTVVAGRGIQCDVSVYPSGETPLRQILIKKGQMKMFRFIYGIKIRMKI